MAALYTCNRETSVLFGRSYGRFREVPNVDPCRKTLVLTLLPFKRTNDLYINDETETDRIFGNDSARAEFQIFFPLAFFPPHFF